MKNRRRRAPAVVAVGLMMVAGAAMAAEVIKVDGDYTKGEKYTGPPLKYKDPSPGVEWTADDSGDANDADHADDADEAGEGTYADEGGVTPTAGQADTADTADTATSGDTTTYADTADNADYADYAEDVAECAGGPFMGGNCGDLRYDGNIGLNADPTVSLDVHGTARVGSLAVNSSAQVSIGGAPEPGAALTVHGEVKANGFALAHNTWVDPSSCNAGGLDTTSDDFFIGTDGWIYSDAVSMFDHVEGIFCPLPVPAGATVTHIDCETSGWVNTQWRARPWNAAGGTPTSLPREVRADEVNFIRAQTFYEDTWGFGGCEVRWTTPYQM